MAKKRILIPSVAKNEEIEVVAAKLVMWGYTVSKGKYDTGESKGIRYIEFSKEDGNNA